MKTRNVREESNNHVYDHDLYTNVEDVSLIVEAGENRGGLVEGSLQVARDSSHQTHQGGSERAKCY